jgi:hypothetical protein
MIHTRRAPRISRIAVSVACLLGACLAISASAVAATVIHFERETVPALTTQLDHGQVHALSFHPASPTGHVHVSLNDGRHMTVAYVSSEQAQLLALASAHNTPVTIAKAKTTVAKPAHHKLRYIAGGILVLVIIVVLGVLLIDRRRKLGEAGGESGGEGAAVPSSSPEQP